MTPACPPSSAPWRAEARVRRGCEVPAHATPTSQIKWALPGPMTMIDTLHDAHYGSREKLAWEFATILNQEAKELEAAGVDVIQFDEPAFNVFFDEVSRLGRRRPGTRVSKG